VNQVCRACNLDKECRKVGKEFLCDGCINIYTVIRRIVIEAMPLDQEDSDV